MSSPSWWQDAICYQIYPRSFADSNGDGIGDLPGVIDKLDYLQSLGVTALWLSPFFPSPNLDWGYDVADYTDVDPDYGTLADAERLIVEAHKRGLRIILDLVLNHSSDQHPWFKQARSSRDNLYRDWYIWRDGVDGGPPNDWESIFGGSAWQYDPASEQYYYHFFFPEQPDLNWRNPAVEEAVFEVVRFWLERGVDGFRLDAISCIYETEGFPDCGVEESLTKMFLDQRRGMFEAGGWEIFEEKVRHQLNHPDVHQLMQRLRELVESYGERILLGETSEVVFYGNGHDELHSVFNFPLISRLEAPLLRQSLAERLPTLPKGAWESNTVGNHDRSRSYSYYSDGRDDEARARMALAMVMFLQGTPVFYYGEEIGMRDSPPTALEEFKDGLGVWFYHALCESGETHNEAYRAALDFCRDSCRTPMQWDGGPKAGFAPVKVEAWLPVSGDQVEGVNVADQQGDPNSILSFFRQIVEVRQEHVVLRRGEMEVIPGTGDVLAFWRRTPEQTLLVALNMSAQVSELALETPIRRCIYKSNNPGNLGQEQSKQLSLQPYEIWIGEMG
jgi:alpha-glucosidase